MYPSAMTGPENPQVSLYDTFTWADVHFLRLIVFLFLKIWFFKSMSFPFEEELNLGDLPGPRSPDPGS